MKWQPIETVPLDRPVLLWRASMDLYKCAVVAGWAVPTFRNGKIYSYWAEIEEPDAQNQN